MKKISAIIFSVIALLCIQIFACAEVVCPFCGETMDPVIDTAVAATCTEAGKTEGSHCSVCGEVLVAQEEIPATGHTEFKDEAVAATCTEAGKTEGSHCSVCGEVLVAQEETPATGHSHAPDDQGTVIAPTCSKQGYTTYTCVNCGVNYIDPDSYTSATGEHVWSEDPATATGDIIYCNTCGVEGYYRVDFVAEGFTYKAQYVAKNGHATAPSPAPEKTGYYFYYWYLNDKNSEYDFNTPVTEPITLRARIHKINYKINLRTYYVDKNGKEHADKEGKYGYIFSQDFGVQKWHGTFSYNQVSFYIENYSAGYAFYFMPNDGYSVKYATVIYDNGFFQDDPGKDGCVITLKNYDIPLMATVTIKVVFKEGIDATQVGAALTGDNSMTWAALAGISLAGAITTGTACYYKKRKEN